jgi:hypothetical protein
MKKRINFTGRKRLASEHIEIRVQRQDGAKHPSFAARLDAAAFKGLDKDAKVYIEPYVVSSSMRFDFGTVSNPQSSADTTLSQLDRNDSFLFRVKVVDESGQVGRILADANGIRPKDAEKDGINRKSLFPVEWIPLGELIWRVDYSSDAGPSLQLTTRVLDFPTKLKNDPLLQGSIYPQAFREVLWNLLRDEGIDDDTLWAQDWRTFIQKLTGTDLSDNPPDEDDFEDFVEEAVRSFSKGHNFASLAKQLEEVTA